MGNSEVFITDCISPRVAVLRDRLRGGANVLEGATTAPPTPEYIGEEPFHRVWMQSEDAPFDVRLARALSAWRSAARPVLTPGHLVVGTPPPRTVISYRTGVFAWDFCLDQQLCKEHPETQPIADYWREWLGKREKPDLPEAARNPALHDSLWITGICCHSTQDYALAIECGIDGLRRRIGEHRNRHPESADWYAAAEAVLDGVAGYIYAHARAAEEQAANATGRQADEWRTIAANCRHIAQYRPETFQQAVQLLYSLFMLNGHDSPGRLDQFLWPALRRDLERGAIDLRGAQEIVDCLYVKFAEHICYGATLGGQLPEGGDATNTASWLCLNSIRRLRLMSPRTALRCHQNTPCELFDAAVHSNATGATFPTFVNDEVIIPGMLLRGATREHARDYTFCGCGQTIPSGRAYGSYEDLVLNAAKPLLYALHNGCDERSGVQTGPQTGTPDSFKAFEEFDEAVWRQLCSLLELGISTTAACRRWGARHVPDHLRSLLTHSCVENGRDWRAGGADYHDGMVDAVGFTNLADSLAVIREVVFREHRFTLQQLVEMLDNDWRDAEDVRLHCLLKVPKFGNGNEQIDAMQARWLKRLNDWLLKQRTAYGGPWGIDIIGWSGAVQLGKVTAATPDGRRAGEPLADCAGAAQGRDRCGITAVMRSMAALPAREIHGPMALSIRLHQSAVSTPAGERKLGDLIRQYFAMGGQQVQVTVASAEELRAAQKEPEKHRDLIVRVGGFSAYYVDLPPEFQEDMIRRTEYVL